MSRGAVLGLLFALLCFCAPACFCLPVCHTLPCTLLLSPWYKLFNTQKETMIGGVVGSELCQKADTYQNHNATNEDVSTCICWSVGCCGSAKPKCLDVEIHSLHSKITTPPVSLSSSHSQLQPPEGHPQDLSDSGCAPGLQHASRPVSTPTGSRQDGNISGAGMMLVAHTHKRQIKRSLM